MLKKNFLLLILIGIGAVIIFWVFGYDQPDAEFSVNIVPVPQEVKLGNGFFRGNQKSGLSIQDESLLPLGKIFCQEFYLLTGFELATNKVSQQKEEITFCIDPTLDKEEYVLEISDTIEIRGGSYQAVAMGSVSLLQMVETRGKTFRAPRIFIHDYPQSDYRGLLVDLARQWHDVKTLEQLILMCRWYKINYMQLHLTDHQSFTFPSQSYPQLPTPDRHYSVQQLQDLERFANEHGVTLVPELDVPGHTGAMIAAMPQLFGIRDTRRNAYCLNMGREEVYTALDTIIGEMSEIFQASPYFHIGGDEAWLGVLDQDLHVRSYLRKHRLADVQELYRHFIVRLNEIVKKHGKITLLWEGFHKEGEVEIPRDIVVFAWETIYQLPQDLLAGGYKVINASWRPTYITQGFRWDPAYIYEWNKFRWENWLNRAPSYIPIQLQPNKNVIGGQMCAWEMRQEMEVPSLRNRLPVLAERLWASESNLPFSDFKLRWESTDRLFQRLICPIEIRAEGLLHPNYVGPVYNRENWFDEDLTLHLQTHFADATIHYTLNGEEPTLNSLRYTQPLVIDKSTPVKLKVYDQNQPLGYTTWIPFDYRPISVKEQGLLTHIRHDRHYLPREKFSESLALTFKSTVANAYIHFTLDGKEPTPSSPRYIEPIEIYHSATVSAQVFDSQGEPRGEPWIRRYTKVDYQKTLTSFKPVVVSNFHGGFLPEDAVDGVVDPDSYWGSLLEGPQWLQIDLEQMIPVSRLQVFHLWNRRNTCQYEVEFSKDGNVWTQVVDMRQNTKSAKPTGDEFIFDPIATRFIRVTLWKCSTNNGLQLIEVRAFGPD